MGLGLIYIIAMVILDSRLVVDGREIEKARRGG